MLDICSRSHDGTPLDATTRTRLMARYHAWSARGIRVLAVATRTLDSPPPYGRDLERELSFAGFLTFLDRPKADAAEAMGGADRIQAVRSLTVEGSGRDLAVGGSVTPEAPPNVNLVADYRRTQFGGWPWPDPAPVHPRDESRFARHPGGRVERPR